MNACELHFLKWGSVKINKLVHSGADCFKIVNNNYYITYIKFILIYYIEVISLNNMNIDENTMKNIKNMVDNGNISDAISSISP